MQSESNKEKIIVISNYAPDEIYLSKEIETLKRKYTVILFHREDSRYRNIRLQDEEGLCVYQVPRISSSSPRFLVSLFVSLFRIETLKELWYLCKSRKLSMTSLKMMLWMSATSALDTDYIKQAIKSNQIDAEGSIIYSYRMDSGALSAVKLKRKLNIGSCIARGHAIDIYEYRNQDDYLPFRQQIMINMDGIYAISYDGYNYLKSRYPSVGSKIHLSRLGTTDFGIEFYKQSRELSLITCSRVDENKRLNRIVEFLKGLKDVNIKWTHIGDGPLLEEVVKSAERELPENIKARFLGNVNNSEVYKIYKDNYFDIFINVSYDEGLPVAIMEAISFGIPVIATDVGGTSEIVENGFNGWLIPRDFENAPVQKLLCSYYYMSDEDKLCLRKNAREKWETSFNQSANYLSFLGMISNKK
jgi:glycosyltransferase involved in cell wall biosynthesis